MTDEMREAFEKWATEHRLPTHKDGVVVTYAARATDDAWQAWCAAIEAHPDAKRLDWIEDNYEGHGGGTEFNLRVRIPHDIDEGGLRHSIDVAISRERKPC